MNRCAWVRTASLFAILGVALSLTACQQQETEGPASPSAPTSREQLETSTEEVSKHMVESFDQLLEGLGEEGVRKMIREKGLEGLRDVLGKEKFESFIEEDGLKKLAGVMGESEMKDLLDDPALKSVASQEELQKMLDEQGLEGLAPMENMEEAESVEEMRKNAEEAMKEMQKKTGGSMPQFPRQ